MRSFRGGVLATDLLLADQADRETWVPRLVSSRVGTSTLSAGYLYGVYRILYMPYVVLLDSLLKVM
jgi:hypothetical protein